MSERRPIADFAACCAMIVASSGAFLLMGLLPIAKLWYHPLERAWTLESSSRLPAGMDFYGRTLYATAAAALAFWVVRALGRRWKLGAASVSRERLWLWLAYALAFTALAMSLFGYQLWPRPAQPLPIPAWYQPR